MSVSLNSIRPFILLITCLVKIYKLCGLSFDFRIIDGVPAYIELSIPRLGLFMNFIRYPDGERLMEEKRWLRSTNSYKRMEVLNVAKIGVKYSCMLRSPLKFLQEVRFCLYQGRYFSLSIWEQRWEVFRVNHEWSLVGEYSEFPRDLFSLKFVTSTSQQLHVNRSIKDRSFYLSSWLFIPSSSICSMSKIH